MTAARVLIVDDEPNICAVWQWALESEGYVVEYVTDGAQALESLQHAEYDLILLDIYMEPVSGLDVLRAVRERDQEVVVIILTGYGSLESAVEALRLGAFDYIFKPATLDIIRQRVREGLRHRKRMMSRRHPSNETENLRQKIERLELEASPSSHLDDPQQFIRAGRLVIDRRRREVTFEGKLLDLTTTEFNLLLELVLAAPEPVSPQKLALAAMGYDCQESEARDLVKWHIYHLRQKLEPNPSEPRYIKTVRYKGYLWTDH